MAKNPKVKSIKTLAENFFPLNLVTYELQESSGKVEELKREVYMSKNGVTALLYNKETDNIILTRQFRLPTFVNKNPTGMLLETPAGLVEYDEDPAEAMIREIEEETGFKVDKVKKVFELYSTPGSVAEMLHYFVAEYNVSQKVSKGGGLDEENEDIEVIEMPFEEAFIKVHSGEIKDAKTVILLQYAKLYLFQEEKVFDIL